MSDVHAVRADIDRAIEGKTLCSVFAETAGRLGPAEALVWDAPAGRRVWTWAKYRENVRDVALGLRAAGLARGAFAAILCRNRPEHVIADNAVVHAGGTPVSLYATLAPEQIAYIMGHCEARVAVVEDASFLERVLKVRAELPALERIVLLEGEPEGDGVLGWDELVETGRVAHEREPGAFEESWRAVEPDDLLTLIYTSGTTGPPKGVMNTHRNVLWDVESLRRVAPLGPDDDVISYLPLAHAADRFLTYWQGIVDGHTTHYCADLAQLLPTMLAVRPTFFGAVPRVWEKLYAGINAAIAAEPDAARREAIGRALAAGRAAALAGGQIPEAAAPILAAIRAKVGLDRCRFSVTGAAPTPREVLEFFHGIGVGIAEVWGMSELSAIATINPPGAVRIGTIGTPLPGVEARIEQDGELSVRGGMTMRGYYKDDGKTGETIDADGWLHTGDVAVADEDGYYTIVDRKKELIITAGGKNISPANIEGLLKQHPLVGQAAVIGDNRAYLTALIVLDGEIAPVWAAKNGIDASGGIAALAADPAVRREIEVAVDEANQRLARVESVRRFTILPSEWTVESGELTPTMKLKRRVIAGKYANEIEALYS